MKRTQENICKFVTESSQASLETLNFVFEKNNVEKNSPRIKATCFMYLAASGSGRLISEDKSFNIDAGTLAFAFTGEKCEISGGDGFEYMYIAFRGERAQGLFERFGISRTNRIFSGFDFLLPFWQNALGQADASNLDLIAESVLLYTFSQMSECSLSGEHRLAGSIIKYIEEYFSDNSLSLASASKQLGYNPKYISRVFSKNVGMTFSEYLKNTRIKHAVFLMENGVSSVKNTAILSGYSDPLYFSSVFKRTVGVSPADYIARVSTGKDKGENK